MAIPSSLSSAFFLLLLLLSISCHGSKARQVRGAETVTNSRLHMLEMRSLMPGSTCNPLPTAPAGSVPLLHRQGPCSPRPLARNSTLIFQRDRSRVNSIRDSLTSLSSSSQSSSEDMNYPTAQGDDLRMPVVAPSAGAGEYVVMVSLGTPRQDLPLIFDTGSSLTWTQCQACANPGRCFEPSKSTTYSKTPCSQTTCSFSVSYADKSVSNGYYAQDTLTLSAGYQFPNFIFGCAQQVSHGFGKYAGILGLAQGYGSFTAQTQGTFGQDFCYCIPPRDSSQGYFLFGVGALANCQTGHYTKILPDQSLYYVKLLGITIGNRRLDFSELAPSSSPSKTIIDSGTTISRLPPSVYSALRDEFKKQMSGYSVAPALSSLGLDTCYDLSGHGSVALRMALNFDGTDVNLDPTGIVWRETDSQVCLAFGASESEEDLTIIGSTQQRNLNILYNILDKRIEFGAGSCGN